MLNTSKKDTNWNSVFMTFTPTADDLTGGSAFLTFLAWGGGGSAVNEPPIVFLEGMNTKPTNVPEPASLSLFGAGALGFGFVRRWRAKRKAQA